MVHTTSSGIAVRTAGGARLHSTGEASTSISRCRACQGVGTAMGRTGSGASDVVRVLTGLLVSSFSEKCGMFLIVGSKLVSSEIFNFSSSKNSFLPHKLCVPCAAQCQKIAHLPLLLVMMYKRVWIF